MQLHLVLLVLLSAALHAGWNALVKAGEDRVLTMAIVMGVGSLAAGLAIPFVTPPAPASWVYLLLSALLHVGYFFFLLQAYRFGDLSHVYPIARGMAPLLVAGGAAVFAGEVLGGFALAGLLLASGAIMSLAFVGDGSRFGRDPRPLLYAGGTAVFIAAYTITDGLGVRASNSPLGFIAWLFFIDGLPLVVFALVARRGLCLPYLCRHWRPGCFGGAICALAYGLVIWVLDQGAMARVSALRETSVIFAAVIGVLLLGEPFGTRRIAAAALIAAGVIILNSGL